MSSLKKSVILGVFAALAISTFVGSKVLFASIVAFLVGVMIGYVAGITGNLVEG